jgi:CDGSH-type Zn-finger protein
MSATEIQVFDNGPCLVKGEGIVLKDGSGKEFNLEGKQQFALCRCGLSKNKPFCDGSHGREGFQSAVEAS